MKPWSKKTTMLALLATMLALFVILDFSYIQAKLVYIFSGNTWIYKNKSTTIPEASLAATMTPSTLVIPTLQVQAPIVYPNEKNENAYQEALKSGVVHFPDTAKPGELGNCYIFGHSSDFLWTSGNYKTVFANLPNLAVGAEIDVSDEQGNKYTYTVTETKVVTPDDLSVLDQHNYEKKLLTLQTSYPIGTALKRWVVVAEMK